MRLLIFLGLLYLLYRVVKSWMGSLNTSKTATTYDQTTPEIDDVMVKDPFCEVYFPKRNGIRITNEGQELFFCSTRCRDKFIEAHSEKRK
ncbi:MAG: hypothetical protein P1P89_17695 [Desulfobacterales bacterium]|nr:hypothetical protein [Desulfobacterales bacterium]